MTRRTDSAMYRRTDASLADTDTDVRGTKSDTGIPPASGDLFIGNFSAGRRIWRLRRGQIRAENPMTIVEPNPANDLLRVDGFFGAHGETVYGISRRTGFFLSSEGFYGADYREAQSVTPSLAAPAIPAVLDRTEGSETGFVFQDILRFNGSIPRTLKAVGIQTDAQTNEVRSLIASAFDEHTTSSGNQITVAFGEPFLRSTVRVGDLFIFDPEPDGIEDAVPLGMDIRDGFMVSTFQNRGVRWSGVGPVGGKIAPFHAGTTRAGSLLILNPSTGTDRVIPVGTYGLDGDGIVALIQADGLPPFPSDELRFGLARVSNGRIESFSALQDILPDFTALSEGLMWMSGA